MRTLTRQPGAYRAAGHHRRGARRRGGPKLHQRTGAVRQAELYGQFTDSGGLNKGDKVRIAGMYVGTVQGPDRRRPCGDRSSRSARNHRHREPAGDPHRHHPGVRRCLRSSREANAAAARGMLPLGQTTTPYQIYDAFFDVTKAAAGWDIDTVKQSLNVLSQTVDQTYPHLGAALDGVAKFSEPSASATSRSSTCSPRPARWPACSVTAANRSTGCCVNAQTLLAAFNERGRAIDALLANVSAFSNQVRGLINDNPNLHQVLEQVARQRRPGRAQGRPGRTR